jgi:hypothetical protein
MKYTAARPSRPVLLGIMALATVVMTTACAPQVLHGPHVDPGASGSLMVGATSGMGDAGTSDGEIYAVLYGGARHGWVSSDNERAASFGLQVPMLSLPFVGIPDDLEILARTSFADLYFQPVRANGEGADFGAGVMASTALVMPYLQYGLTSSGGNSWYTTQGVLLPTEVDHAVWMPSMSFRDAGRGNGKAVNYTIGAGIAMSRGLQESVLTFSITAELGLDRRQ